jgi:2-desacetyl-2-hydroxyethyl bacteriochlorophyllide A dehydrogenase
MDMQDRAAAVVFAGPRTVTISDVDLPPLDDGDALISTRWSGISSGTELLAYRGELDPELPLDETLGALAGTFTYPFSYGYSCVGVVERTNANLPEGTLVFAYHPHQDRFVARADDLIVLDGVDPRQATLMPLVETALQIALDAGAVLDTDVVVFGLGAVGMLTSLMLARAGARVLAVEPRGWRQRVAGDLGIPAVAPGDLTAALEERDLAGGVSLAVEASGNPDALVAALDVLSHEGTVQCASWYGTKTVPLPLGGRFHRRRLTIRSTQVSTIPARLSGLWTIARRRTAAASLLREMPLSFLATHQFPFARVAEAYAAVDEGAEGLVHAALCYG